MRDPKVLDYIIDTIEKGDVRWLWLAPPCSSFSAAQNGCVRGRLRSNERPEGERPDDPRVIEGNALWDHAIRIIKCCLLRGVGFVLEHPVSSYAWKLPESRQILNHPNVSRILLHLCMFADSAETRTKKPTQLLTSISLLKELGKTCDGRHSHAPHLCGIRAKQAAQYSRNFGDVVANILALWLRPPLRAD